MGRQNVPRDQWLAIGVECPHCGERVTRRMSTPGAPTPDDPKLLLLYCPDCGDRSSQPRLTLEARHGLVPPTGFEPVISTLKGWRPRPLDDGGVADRRLMVSQGP